MSTELVAGFGDGANQLIELELSDLRVPVLGVLNQEYHQESHDGRRRVDRQLPPSRVVEHRTGDRPDDDQNRAMANAQAEPTACAVQVATRRKPDEVSVMN